MRFGPRADFLIKRPQLVISEGSGDEGQFFRLFLHGRKDFRVAMALIDGGIGRQAVHVFIAFNVPDPDAFAPVQDDIQRLVIF